MLTSRASRRLRGAASEPDRDLARQREVVTRPLGQPFRPLPAHHPGSCPVGGVMSSSPDTGLAGVIGTSLWNRQLRQDSSR